MDAAAEPTTVHVYVHVVLVQDKIIFHERPEIVVVDPIGLVKNVLKDYHEG